MTLVEPQRIFLGGPSRNYKELQGQRTSLKELEGIPRTTENLQRNHKNTTTPFLATLSVLDAFLDRASAKKSSLDCFCQLETNDAETHPGLTNHSKLLFLALALSKKASKTLRVAKKRRSGVFVVSLKIFRCPWNSF